MQPILPQPESSIAPFDDEEYEEQCLVSSFWTASRLLVIVGIFLFGTFVFAYFYLRALNSSHAWRVHHQHPSMIIGTMVAVCVVLAALVHYVGARRLQIGSLWDWQVSSLVSLIVTAIAAGLQVWEMTRLPFSPASSGYTSVFVAWMPVYILFIIGQWFWLEILLARSVRAPEAVLAETEEGVLIVSRFGANVEGFVLFSEFMVVSAIAIWILFYVL